MLVAGGIRALSWLIGPILLALVIVLAISPVATWLRRHGWPRWLTTTLVTVLSGGTVAVLAAGIGISVARFAGLVPRYAGQANALIDSATARLAELGFTPGQLGGIRTALDPAKLITALTQLAAGITGVVSNVVFLGVLLLFVSIESGSADRRLAAIAVGRPHVASALSRFATGTRRYLVVTTVFGLVVAGLDAIALAVIGIPDVFVWGLLSFVTNYIPNVGFVIGLIPPALLGLLTGGPREMLVVIAVYSVLNFVLQSLVQPRFVGDAVGLSATVTFVALVFWAWLLGPLGAVLAIPATLLAKTLLVDVDPAAKWADALLRAGVRPGSGARQRK